MKREDNNSSDEELAAIINRSFENLEEKMGNGFADLKARLDGIESKIDQMQGQIYNVREDLSRLNRRVETLEKAEAA